MRWIYDVNNKFVMAKGKSGISLQGGYCYKEDYTINLSTTSDLKKGNYYYLYPCNFRSGSTAYRIKTLNEYYDWYLVYVDNNGKATLTRKGKAPAQGIEINTTNFPDKNFRNYLLSQSYGQDGVLTEDEIRRTTIIGLSRKNIGSLKGIEYFTALEYLICSDNQLTSIDLTKNTLLLALSCDGNQLTSLDVSKNTKLNTLWCYDNQLTTLNLSNNNALEILYCYNNQLTTLDVSKSTALEKLACQTNKLTSLNLPTSTALTYLSCYDNQLLSLNMSKNTALEKIYCHNNKLVSLEVSKNTALKELACLNNQLTTLDVSKNIALKELYCSNNQLTSLDLSKNTKLTYLACDRNKINGTAMDNLISSLPQNSTSDVHYFRVINPKNENEGNVCTWTQTAAAKAKGWLPCYYDSETESYIEYGGE